MFSTRFLYKATFGLSLMLAALCNDTAYAKSRHHTAPRYAPRRRVIQCVAFIHQTTNFQVHGNAKDWWALSAQKHYERGHKPEIASVLSFRPTGRMVLGHVALVKKLVDSRTILIDHSHWGTDGITHNVRVVDVSRHNDWTRVRVAINGHPELLGSVYPTNGFIYPRFQVKSNPHEIRTKDILEAKWRKQSETSSVQLAKKNEDSVSLLKSGVLENGPYKGL